MVRAALVADPVAVRVPERSGVERDDLPAPPREALREDAAARAAADDDEVDLVVVVEAAHVAPQLRDWCGCRRSGAATPTRSGRGRRPGQSVSAGPSGRDGPVLVTSARAASTVAAHGIGIARRRARDVSHGSRRSSAECLVPAGYAGPAEADLVPRPRVRVERGRRVAHPQPNTRACRACRATCLGAVRHLLDERASGRRESSSANARAEPATARRRRAPASERCHASPSSGMSS